jgi:hypothetical protein
VIVNNQDSQIDTFISQPEGGGCTLRAIRLYGGFPENNPVDTLQGIPHANVAEWKISLVSRLLPAFLLARPPHSLRCTT